MSWMSGWLGGWFGATALPASAILGDLLDIRAALETRLSAIAVPLATVWENTAFTGEPIQEADVIFHAPSDHKIRIEEGIFVVRLRYPLSNGTAAIGARADTLRAWFARGMSLDAGNRKVILSKTASISGGEIMRSSYTMTIQIPFFAPPI